MPRPSEENIDHTLHPLHKKLDAIERKLGETAKVKILRLRLKIKHGRNSFANAWRRECSSLTREKLDDFVNECEREIQQLATGGAA